MTTLRTSLPSNAALAALLALFTAGAARAQNVTARSFLPRDYTAELRVDMAAIVESGLWDAVERSPLLRMGLASFRTEFGFDLADIDRVRLAQRVDPPAEGRPDWERQRTQVWIFEGPETVGTERVASDTLAAAKVSTVGGVRVISPYAGTEFASPAPGLLVHAHAIGMPISADDPEPAGLVTETLLGARRGGVPVPELVALTASPRALVVFAGVESAEMPLRADTLQPFPESWFDPDDLPIGIRIQLVRSANGEELSLEMLVRFDGDSGPLRMSEGFDASMAELAAHPPARALAKLLEPVRKELSGSDLTLVLELGSDRSSAARFSQLIGGAVPLLLVAPARAEQPIVFEIDGGEAVLEAAEEPPVEVPPGRKKK